jgi:probable F420-dependent oxidoreductase
MKFGVLFQGIRPDAAIEAAQKAEVLGYESLWRADHLVMPVERAATYPYREDHTVPFATDWPILDALGFLTFLAAVTSRVKLGTAVYILPLRDPIVTARQVLTIDYLSQGRMLFGIGVGWLAEEFAIVDQDFRSRGARTDEIIRILKALWTEPQIEFRGKHYSFGPVTFEPKPVSRPHPPIIVGGSTDAALRRAARLGDGWYAPPQPAEQARDFVTKLTQLRREAGRAQEPFEVTLGASAEIEVDEVRRLEEAGVDRLVVLLWERTRDAVPNLGRFAERVLAHV